MASVSARAGTNTSVDTNDVPGTIFFESDQMHVEYGDNDGTGDGEPCAEFSITNHDTTADLFVSVAPNHDDGTAAVNAGATLFGRIPPGETRQFFAIGKGGEGGISRVRGYYDSGVTTNKVSWMVTGMGSNPRAHSGAAPV